MSDNQQGEPIGYTDEHGNAYQYGYTGPKFAPNIQLYTTPQQPSTIVRTWVGLTDEEIDYQAKKDDHGFYFALGALWAQSKLKEKNCDTW